MFAEVTTALLDESAYVEKLRQSSHNAGAIVTFTGLVRDYNSDGAIEGISLEQYPGMTANAMQQLLQHASDRFALLSAGIVHRVGYIGNYEPVVWVGCSASHRKAAFDGAEFVMDMLKKSVPLWKKEHADGKTAWVAAKASDEEAAMKWLRNEGLSDNL